MDWPPGHDGRRFSPPRHGRRGRRSQHSPRRGAPTGRPARYHSSITNSGACRAVRSRLRKTLVRAKIRLSPAARSFFIANSGEVCRYASCRDPSGEMSVVAKPCKWVSFPGEAWRTAGCASTKPLASNQRRSKAETSARAASRPRRSAYRSLLQKGGATVELKRHRGGKEGRIEVDPGWRLAAKSVWCARQAPIRQSAQVSYSGGEFAPSILGTRRESYRKLDSEGQHYRT